MNPARTFLAAPHVVGVGDEFLVERVDEPHGDDVVVLFAHLFQIGNEGVEDAGAQRHERILEAEVEFQSFPKSDLGIGDDAPVVFAIHAGTEVGGGGPAVLDLVGAHQSAPSEACTDGTAAAPVFVVEHHRHFHVIEVKFVFDFVVERYGEILVVPEQRYGVVQGGVGAVGVLETAFLGVEQFDGGEPVEAVVERHHDGETAVETGLVKTGHLVAIDLREVGAGDDGTDEALGLCRAGEGEYQKAKNQFLHVFHFTAAKLHHFLHFPLFYGENNIQSQTSLFHYP